MVIDRLSVSYTFGAVICPAKDLYEGRLNTPDLQVRAFQTLHTFRGYGFGITWSDWTYQFIPTEQKADEVIQQLIKKYGSQIDEQTLFPHHAAHGKIVFAKGVKAQLPLDELVKAEQIMARHLGCHVDLLIPLLRKK